VIRLADGNPALLLFRVIGIAAIGKHRCCFIKIDAVLTKVLSGFATVPFKLDWTLRLIRTEPSYAAEQMIYRTMHHLTRRHKRFLGGPIPFAHRITGISDAFQPLFLSLIR
jgi:hypothetical protein